MNGRQAYRAATVKNDKDKGPAKLHQKERKECHGDALISDSMAQAIDHKDALGRYERHIENLAKTKDVNAFFGNIGPDMALQLMMIATSGETEKSRLEALKDLLDRAGFGKVNKHAVASITPETSKETLMSLIMGANKELEKSGIEIVDDDEDQKE